MKIKTFKHHPTPDLGYTDLKCVTKGKRTYETPDGTNKYPSITTVLSLQSKEAINAWRDRVGHTEANRISRIASGRGTAVHQIAEDYINNNPDFKKNANPLYYYDFLPIKKTIDSRLSAIYAQEVALYSDYLKVAGRVDCVGIFDNKLSIIDFKTSRKTKKKSWCTSYFMQECFYAIAWEERTKMPITQLVTIIAVDDISEAQVFIEHRDSHDQNLIKCIKEYNINENN